ncbi:MAG: hypothetical protein OEV73_01735 [Desulfobulbaceae bacterium]|nr:hypothetical protein [Desulfobulbaceae bacterium]
MTNHRLITDNRSLRANYDNLDAGDCIVGRIRLKNGEEAILLDLVERGVRIFPAALAQLSSRSKCLQTRLFAQEMLPHTTVIHDLHDMQEAITCYQRNGIDKVITKHDRRNAGMGILLWNATEEVFAQASFGNMRFPFVLQPYVQDGRDIRVIVLGDYCEAYWRHNPHNFRNNLHFGGEGRPCKLTDGQWQLCQRVMRRGKYPYAHLDLLVTPDETTWLTEINLRGGIRGAQITPAAYREKLTAIHHGAITAFNLPASPAAG